MDGQHAPEPGWRECPDGHSGVYMTAADLRVPGIPENLRCIYLCGKAMVRA